MYVRTGVGLRGTIFGPCLEWPYMEDDNFWGIGPTSFGHRAIYNSNFQNYQAPMKYINRNVFGSQNPIREQEDQA